MTGNAPWVQGLPGLESVPPPGDLKPVDIPAARLKAVRHRWFRRHPLCGAVLGCNGACPHFGPEIHPGNLFPHCRHPDQFKVEFRP